MQWSVAQAKQKFSEVIRASAEEPPLIFNRDRLVGAVIDAESYEAFQSWRAQQKGATLAGAFDELRQLCAETGYTLSVPTRQDRANAFTEILDDVSM